MSKYTKLDQAILTSIKEQPRDLSNLACIMRVRNESPVPIWETVGRRLQVLRKAGKIIFYNGKWLLAAQRGE